MKPSTRFAFRPAIGLYIDQHQIAMSVTAATPRGRREIARDIQPCENVPAEEVVGRMLKPWLSPAVSRRSGPKPWVRIGLPEARVFQAVVAITGSNRQHNAQSYFLEAVQATNVRAEDRIVEMVKLTVGDRPLACVAASPRNVIESSVEMMNKLGTRVGLIESGPTSLFRAGAYHRTVRHGSKLCVRFFLGEVQAIGIMAAGVQPLFWHTFDLTPGEETPSVLAAYSTLWMMGRHARITVPVDTVVIHGRPQLTLTQKEQETFEARTKTRLVRCAEPSYDAASAALGLSLANIFSDDGGLNLARTLKPAFTIRDIFPYGELIAHGALLGAASLFLIGASLETSQRLRSVTGALKAFPWLTTQDHTKLDAEKKTVQDRLKAISAFQDSRVNWSGLLRKIAVNMPENTLITTLNGDAEIASKSHSGSSKAKKKLVVTFETPLADNGSLPPEIDKLLASLRSDKTLKRHFPLVEVTGFRSNPARKDLAAAASYSIVCLPAADKTKNPGGH